MAGHAEWRSLEVPEGAQGLHVRFARGRTVLGPVRLTVTSPSGDPFVVRTRSEDSTARLNWAGKDLPEGTAELRVSYHGDVPMPVEAIWLGDAGGGVASEFLPAWTRKNWSERTA